jgi:esterase/lipase
MANPRFASALAEFDAVASAERNDPAIDPRCAAFLLHHGAATDRAIVLFHGFTNCPRQMTSLAQLFSRAGFNVYVPRLPRHGLLDKLTPDLANLTADELSACGGQAVQLCSGLGTRVVALGLSAGATIAAWVAQTQAVDRVIAIAPFFSVVRIPALLEPALAGALEHLPNLQLWWDPRVKEHAEPAHAYPRFATHALAACLQLGAGVRDLAQEAPPQAALSILVLNDKDPAVDNGAARDVWALWRQHGGTTDAYTFENLDARHDIIEPVTFPDAARLVYPVLLRLAAS